MKNKLLVGLCLLCASSLVRANVILLDFEGVGSQVSVSEFYNGGTDGAGNSGFDYGVSFGSDALGLKESDPAANISGMPSIDTVMVFLTGTAILNFESGFDTGFSFYYSTTTFSAIVDVFDDINGTGNLLGSINIGALGIGPDPENNFSNWEIGSLGFAGVAKSIDFGGTANFVIYDNITFGSVNPNQVSVPEPISLTLFGLGLAGIGFSRKRKLKQF